MLRVRPCRLNGGTSSTSCSRDEPLKSLQTIPAISKPSSAYPRTAAPPTPAKKVGPRFDAPSGENGAAVRRQVADGPYDAARELAEQGIDPLPQLDRLGTSVLLRRPKTDAVPLVTEDGSVR